MFYKYNTDSNEWWTGNEVHFPDGQKLTSENRHSRDGWEWHDEPPAEYSSWLEGQQPQGE